MARGPGPVKMRSGQWILGGHRHARPDFFSEFLCCRKANRLLSDKYADNVFFFRNRFKSILSMYLFMEGYALGRKPPNMEQAKIEPPRPLPSISLSHLPVRKRFELLSRFSIDLYGKSRTKPWEASEIRRVTDA